MPYQTLSAPRLTLNVEELFKTQVLVPLNQTAGAPFFNLESVNSNSDFGLFNLPASTGMQSSLGFVRF